MFEILLFVIFNGIFKAGLAIKLFRSGEFKAELLLSIEVVCDKYSFVMCNKDNFLVCRKFRFYTKSVNLPHTHHTPQPIPRTYKVRNMVILYNPQPKPCITLSLTV